MLRCIAVIRSAKEGKVKIRLYGIGRNMSATRGKYIFRLCSNILEKGFDLINGPNVKALLSVEVLGCDGIEGLRGHRK